MGCCDSDIQASPAPQYRRVLWVVLLINAVMFVVEATSGVLADSRALQADALDFLGDTATYGLTLWALGQSLAWRLRAARIKGVSLLVMGVIVLGNSVWALLQGNAPQGQMMMGVAGLALAANVVSALLLMRHRQGDANIRSVWLCSRNDAIANLAVLLSGALVVWQGSRWPDLLVALAIAGLFTHSAVSILRQASNEQQPDHCG
ncbi:MAG: cation diffusion facilitator family transporter [Alcanivorax sp.]|jgi:cation diffusion facilitator family transporter|uniref:cation diffusion facilitator family transporter n=1 Tax=Alcanivorax sp. TaxID=1872427 RepID=UPI0019BD759E|nr:cation diffusion facilitator family transporter [Alcanivorax sp.]MBD3645736.1 cation transporter [Alcanivorax sp.]MDF1723174.1 cation diffusion facilitator family transporter [Alcanivorax sp.]